MIIAAQCRDAIRSVGEHGECVLYRKFFNIGILYILLFSTVILLLLFQQENSPDVPSLVSASDYLEFRVRPLRARRSYRPDRDRTNTDPLRPRGKSETLP